MSIYTLLSFILWVNLFYMGQNLIKEVMLDLYGEEIARRVRKYWIAVLIVSFFFSCASIVAGFLILIYLFLGFREYSHYIWDALKGNKNKLNTFKIIIALVILFITIIA